MNPKVDFFFTKAKSWKSEYELLREIALESGLNEVLKWGCPTYALNDKNIFLIHGFKDYCALLFMKGALLKDPKGILIQQTKNVQSARQMRFTSAKEIKSLKTQISNYIQEAIELEKSGAKVEMKKTVEFEMPVEFQIKLDKDKKLKTAFESLTPGRQRAYLLYFSQAKQSKTRVDRIEKYRDVILAGKGLND